MGAKLLMPFEPRLHSLTRELLRVIETPRLRVFQRTRIDAELDIERIREDK